MDSSIKNIPSLSSKRRAFLITLSLLILTQRRKIGEKYCFKPNFVLLLLFLILRSENFLQKFLSVERTMFDKTRNSKYQGFTQFFVVVVVVVTFLYRNFIVCPTAWSNMTDVHSRMVNPRSSLYLWKPKLIMFNFFSVEEFEFLTLLEFRK